jgi:hypothetical protein
VVRAVHIVRRVLATFVVRVVANGGADDELAGQVEHAETGAKAVFRDTTELVALLRGGPDEWGRTT